LAVSAPSVSPNLVNPAVALDNQERVRALTQQLLSEAVLRRVVEQEGLGTGDAARPHIGRIRSSIRVSVPEPVSRSDENRRLDAYDVTYTDSDPARAQRIVNRLADVFVEENTNTRTASAESTTAFLIAERDRSQARLADIEARLRKAKEAFLGRLPEQTGANLQTLAGLRQQLEVSATSLRHQQDRLAMTQRQIDLVEQEAASGVAVSSLGSGR